MSHNLIGQTLLGQYRVDAFVASGGIGAVFRVWDQRRNVPLAMKVLHSDLQEDPSIFKREADALEKLAHPNIVPFYGLHTTEDGEIAFLLSRFVDGVTLKEILRRHGQQPLPAEQALVYLKTPSSVLSYAHANGVIHCDVKPGNIMVDEGGAVYLTDFGISRHAESTTTTLASAGTAAYLAPEQCRGESVSAQTDVYALGVMFYELLTGSRPFRGDEAETETSGTTAAERIRYAHVNVTPRDPREINPALPEALAAVVLKALSKDPQDRYGGVREFYEMACAAAGINPDTVPDRVGPTVETTRQAARPMPTIPDTPMAAPQQPQEDMRTVPDMPAAQDEDAFRTLAASPEPDDGMRTVPDMPAVQADDDMRTVPDVGAAQPPPATPQPTPTPAPLRTPVPAVVPPAQTTLARSARSGISWQLIAVAVAVMVLGSVIGVGLALFGGQLFNRGPSVEYVVDASMSMADTGAPSRLEVALRGLDFNLRQQMLRQANVGLRVYGNGQSGAGCQDTTLLVPVEGGDAEAVGLGLSSLTPAAEEGAIPMTEAILQGIADLESQPAPRTLVVLAGNADTCISDSAPAIQDAVERSEVVLQIISYQAPIDAVEAFSGLAGAVANASYVNAQDPDTFGTLLAESGLRIVDPEQPLMEPEEVARFAVHDIDTETGGASDMVVEDLDGDGDLDIIATISSADRVVWYENSGGSDPEFTPHVVDQSLPGMAAIALSDLDRNGALDLAGMGSGDLMWWSAESDVFEGLSRGSVAFSGGLDITVADVDGDGSRDIISAVTNEGKITWWRNDGGSPPAFELAGTEVFPSLPSVSSIAAADVNRDGAVDVAAVSPTASVYWAENLGGNPPEFAPRLISSDVPPSPERVAVADMDGDGSLDLIVTDPTNGQVVWFENGGTGLDWTEHVLLTQLDNILGVSVHDMNRDGYVDLLATLSGSEGGFVLWESGGGPAPSFLAFEMVPVDGQYAGAAAILGGDIDGDGDQDAVAASQGGVIWLERVALETVEIPEAWYSGSRIADAGESGASAAASGICGNGTLEGGEQCEFGESEPLPDICRAAFLDDAEGVAGSLIDAKLLFARWEPPCQDRDGAGNYCPPTPGQVELTPNAEELCEFIIGANPDDLPQELARLHPNRLGSIQYQWETYVGDEAYGVRHTAATMLHIRTYDLDNQQPDEDMAACLTQLSVDLVDTAASLPYGALAKPGEYDDAAAVYFGDSADAVQTWLDERRGECSALEAAAGGAFGCSGGLSCNQGTCLCEQVQAVCGDNILQPGEACDVAAACGTGPDGSSDDVAACRLLSSQCSGGEVCQDCACVDYCGNDICSNGETPSSCPEDCEVEESVCGDGKITGREQCESTSDCSPGLVCGDPSLGSNGCLCLTASGDRTEQASGQGQSSSSSTTSGDKEYETISNWVWDCACATNVNPVRYTYDLYDVTVEKGTETIVSRTLTASGVSSGWVPRCPAEWVCRGEPEP
jgi:serine/threonine protein kinase